MGALQRLWLSILRSNPERVTALGMRIIFHHSLVSEYGSREFSTISYYGKSQIRSCLRTCCQLQAKRTLHSTHKSVVDPRRIHTSHVNIMARDGFLPKRTSERVSAAEISLVVICGLPASVASIPRRCNLLRGISGADLSFF